MPSHRLTKLVCVAGALLWSTLAVGQTAPPSSEEPTDTSVLRLDLDNVDSDLARDVRSALIEAVDGHPSMRVTERPEVTLSDFTLTVGCDSRDPKCLSSLAPYVDADRLVFGRIEREENLYRVDVGIFDLRKGRMMYRLQDRKVRGDEATARRAIPALVDGMLYGDIGSVEVKVRGGDGARVAFDGAFRGPAPTVLQNLPLGQHTVTVTTGDGATKSRVVLLKREGTTRVVFDFGTPVDGEEDGPATSSVVPGIVVTAAGLGGLTLGILSNIQLNQLDDEAAAAMRQSSNGSYVDRSELERADGDPEVHVRMTRSASARAAVGYSVGAVGLAVGTYLLYRALDREGRMDPERPRALRVTPTIHRRGAGVGLQLDY